MQVVIKFNADNSAFEDDFRGECRKVFERALQHLSDDDLWLAELRDSNGNKVGTIEVVKE